ncbi:MAG: elongation factor G [Candidatus Marinimicrobia bacterium]|jgi:elongation factor G|nr:elongation factor G [Candidatus Neomarinimicrobiota bacterium]MDP6789519.1 elongation factor G [Candidatus Neomarinimicrobiota bacterium]MDP7072750.1 elongation factor G [Candidatus Neomarinimicrobiota bacterium]
MKEYASGDIRNFALVGHGASGKTMLAESMLVCAGEINRLGTIEAGSTVSDYHPEEKERQISIHSCPLHLEWEGKKFNFIDAPGYMDFIGEAISSLAVADLSVVVIHAVNGVEVGTEQVVGYSTGFDIPKVLVINGLDREHTKFDTILAQCKKRFGNKVFPMQLPVNAGPGFNQIVDVLRKELITYKTDGSGTFSEEALPEDWEEKVNQLHEELIEYVAESDDTLLEKFFDEGGLSEEEMRGGIHQAVQDQSFIPLFCTAAGSTIGVARLMDFLSKYGSSPLDREKVSATKPNSEEEVEVRLDGSDPVVFVFKTISEAHVGELSFFRVYSGKVSTGMDLYNASQGHSERFGQMFVLNGKNRTSLSALNAGDIGAVVKLKSTHTGDTLCLSKNPVHLKGVDYPNPNIHMAIKSKSKGDEEKLAVGLATIHEEDPTFVYHVDPELKQTVISGQGELHLQVAVGSLSRNYNVELDMMQPKIPYRETIKGAGDSKYRHKKQSGGAGQFAEVWMRIEPSERGRGVEFNESLVGQNVDRVFVPSVEKGVTAACVDGIIAGYRVVDVKVDFYDGKQHPVDSKDIAFQIAGKEAFKEAFRSAQPCLLEPIMDVSIKVPEDYMGDVMGDLSSRRGKIQGMDSEGALQIVNAKVPQGELHHYSTRLRSLTGGRGLHSEAFSHYEEMPRELESRVSSAHQNEDE